MVNKLSRHPRRHHALRPAGFALLELITALFVISVGIFGIMDMYLRVMDGNRQLQQYATAATVLRNAVETLHAQGDAALVPGSYPLPLEESATNGLFKAEGFVVVSPSDTGIESLRQVEVQLRWQADTGRLIDKKLVTLMRVRGVAP